MNKSIQKLGSVCRETKIHIVSWNINAFPQMDWHVFHSFNELVNYTQYIILLHNKTYKYEYSVTNMENFLTRDPSLYYLYSLFTINQSHRWSKYEWIVMFRFVFSIVVNFGRTRTFCESPLIQGWWILGGQYMMIHFCAFALRRLENKGYLFFYSAIGI